MYENARTSVRNMSSETEDFKERVCSFASYFVFPELMDEITKKVQSEIPWWG